MTPTRSPARPRNRAQARDDHAATQLVALLVGVALFAGVASFAIAFSDRDNQRREGDTSAHATMAANVALRLLATPGVPHAWETLASGDIATLGLASGVDAPFEVDPAKLQRFRGPDHPPDARIANLTGLEGYGVHLRLEPAIGVMPNGTVTDFASTPLAYVAHRDGNVAASKASAASTRGAAAEQAYLRELAFQFRDATAGSVAYATTGDVHPDSQPDLTRELVPRLAGFDSVQYSDGAATTGTWKVVREGQYASSAWWTNAPERVLTTSDYSAATRTFVPQPREHSLTLPRVDLTDLGPGWLTRLKLTHWFDAGTPTPFPDTVRALAQCIANCTGSTNEVELWSATADIGSKTSLVETTIELGAFNGQTLRIRLELDWNSLPGHGAATGEGWFITRTQVDTTRTSTITLYDNDLDYNTTTYRALVVGSDADHAAFLASDNVVRAAITDWAVAGGRLLVLGSADANAAWLEGTFTDTTATATASALLTDASDLTHPLVARPHALRIASLDWKTPSLPPTPVYVTILRGEEEMANGQHAPLLSVTRATHRFTGAVLLATARVGPAADEETAREALANWLAYLTRAEDYTELGDSVQKDTPFGYSSGVLTIRQDDNGRERPAVLTVFVWR